MSILSGIHPVAEALRSNHPLERVLVAQGAGGQRLQEIIDLARRASVPVRFEPRSALDRLAGSAAHQGVVALGTAKKYADLAVVAGSELVVVLDGVEDPHNLGAIIRTAHAAGAGGVIIPERRAAGITDVVAKAAAGALEYVPLTRVTNINRALEDLKERGYWIYGLDERGTEDYTAWISVRRRPSFWAAKARGCTNRSAGIATCWFASPWRERFPRSTSRWRRE